MLMRERQGLGGFSPCTSTRCTSTICYSSRPALPHYSLLHSPLFPAHFSVLIAAAGLGRVFTTHRAIINIRTACTACRQHCRCGPCAPPAARPRSDGTCSHDRGVNCMGGVKVEAMKVWNVVAGICGCMNANCFT